MARFWPSEPCGGLKHAVLRWSWQRRDQIHGLETVDIAVSQLGRVPGIVALEDGKLVDELAFGLCGEAEIPIGLRVEEHRAIADKAEVKRRARHGLYRKRTRRACGAPALELFVRDADDAGEPAQFERAARRPFGVLAGHAEVDQFDMRLIYAFHFTLLLSAAKSCSSPRLCAASRYPNFIRI